MSRLANRVVSVYNRKTSMRLAPSEWEAIDLICEKENISRKTLFELIDLNRDTKIGLTAAIRLFTIIYYKNVNTISQKKDKTDALKNQLLAAIKEII